MISAGSKKPMTKNQAESSNSLSVFFLKKHGYFDKNLSWKSGTVTWTYGYSENKSSIGIIMKRNDWNMQNEKTIMILVKQVIISSKDGPSVIRVMMRIIRTTSDP